MKKIMIAYSILIFSFLVSGCQEWDDHKEHQTTKEEEIKAPRVEIIANEHVNKAEEVQIVANVYFGEELVDDAEVTFEIKLVDKSEKVEAKLVDTGTYEIDYIFKENGTYQVTAHTNVKSYHTMPTMDIQVGEGTTAMTAEEHEDESTESDHHHSSVQIKVDKLTGFQVNTDEQLSTTVKESDQPFSEAMVRFEIWKDGEEYHHYIDAAESKTKGTYVSSYKFEEPGKYKIVVHVEKEEVHDHIETSVDVQ
jgi:hypothetical protein